MSLASEKVRGLRNSDWDLVKGIVKNYLTASILEFVEVNHNSSENSEVKDNKSIESGEENIKLTEADKEQIKEYIIFFMNKAQNCIKIEDIEEVNTHNIIVNHNQPQIAVEQEMTEKSVIEEELNITEGDYIDEELKASSEESVKER